MRRQVLRRLRALTLCEVGGCADDRHAHVGADPDRDHVLRHLLAKTNAGIETFGHDIGQAIVDDDLGMDIRIVRQEPGQRRPENGARGVLACRDADGAGGFVAQVTESCELRLDLVEARAERTHQPLARLGRRHAPRRARQQPDPEPLFELAHRMAQRGLGHPEPGRRLGKAALPRHREERDQVVDIGSGHS